MLESRAAPSDMIDDGAAQLVVFDADSNGFSRAVIFNQHMSAARLGRMVQRVVEMERIVFSLCWGLQSPRSSGKLQNWPIV